MGMNLVEWPDALTMPNMPTLHCLQVKDLISSLTAFACACFSLSLRICFGGFVLSQLYFDSPENPVIKESLLFKISMETVHLLQKKPSPHLSMLSCLQRRVAT